MNVVFLIYNRSELTARVFAEIARARPDRLFIVADGPKPDVPGDVEQVRRVRETVEQVCWPCEVARDYSAVNLGCKRRVSSGLDWVFSCVEEAVVIEDDCLPDPSFFLFCDELLDRYRRDEQIMHVGGNCFLERNVPTCSYFFSKYNHIWGWATWRRAWRHFDVAMAEWPKARAERWLETVCLSEAEVSYWTDRFDHAYGGAIDTWDYAWIFACMRGGVSILPTCTLVSNIGFGVGATHTLDARSPLGRMKTRPMKFPLQHPPEVVRDVDADRAACDRIFLRRPSGMHRFVGRLTNRWWYGALFRKIPVLGPAWDRRRKRARAQPGGPAQDH